MEQKQKFDNVFDDIQTQFGKETIPNFSEIKELPVISSGSLALNKALGIGGFPQGRIIEIYGTESCGKTTIALQAISQFQKNNLKCAYIDAEHALSYQYCLQNHIDVSSLLIAHPETGEEAFTIIEALIKTKQISLIVVDSVAALVPEAELNGDFESQTIGLHARLMSKGLRILQTILARIPVTIIFINQIREKVGILFGDNKVTTGGWALKFFSSIRLEVKRAEVIKNGTNVIGIKSNVKVTKNKLAPPLSIASINIFFDHGYDEISEVIDLALENKIINKNGAWFYYKKNKIAQGKEATRLFLAKEENQQMYEEIKQQII